MPHQHETCSRYNCNRGVILSHCDADDCNNPDCMSTHCDCKCHAGKTCDCGHAWPRMCARCMNVSETACRICRIPICRSCLIDHHHSGYGTPDE